jgi:hypothetical protein
MRADPAGSEPSWRTRTVLVYSAVGGGAALVLWVIGAMIEPRQAFASYLFAYVTVLTVVAGALLQVMISHVTGARWFTVLRRLSISLAASLPALALLLLPVLLGERQLYPWASVPRLTLPDQKLALHRQAWLNVPFFTTRAILYVVVFAMFGEMLRRWSMREDRIATDHDVAAIVLRQRRLSAFGLIAVGLCLTFVAFDWLMPLESEWYSTVYGVYVFAGGFVSALGLIAVVAKAAVQPRGALSGSVTPEHFGALGKLMLTFVIFWGYIAFSQFLIIWIGDIPADASWYVVRAGGSWGTLGLMVAIGQFGIPFVLLLSRTLKRTPVALASIGAWLLLMHVLDVYWLVLPAFHPGGIHVSWLDCVSLVMVGGIATAAAAWRARDQTPVPVRDPYLAESVTYVEP